MKDGAVYTNSRDVAEYFGKNHYDVLKDIDRIKGQLVGVGKFSDTPLFHLVTTMNEQNKVSYRSFDMTKDGFTLLVMGYTGAKAMAFKVAYIQRFNEMEAALHPAGLGLSIIGET